jgi:cysteine desulfurase
VELAYLDHAAATPMRPEVRREVLAVLDRAPGNPSSVHRAGRMAREILEAARRRIGEVLGLPHETVYFVRGGTESDNLAILGRAARVRAEGKTPVLARSAVEHSAVRGAVDGAVREGGRAVVLPVSPDGGLDPAALAGILDEGPDLVSLIWVNHETGSILPVPRVVEACRESGVPVHVDGVQAPGRIPLDPGVLAADLLTLSAHKLGGPRSTAILVVRDPTLLSPRLFGGGQEGGNRPGTEDVAGAHGMAVALEAAAGEQPEEARRLGELRDRLENGLRGRIEGLVVHGAEGPRAPHISNVGVPGLPRDLLPRALDLEGVAVSAGSACRSGATDVSPVLAAYYGEDAARARAPLRLSLGWTTREEEIERALERIPVVVARAREAGLALEEVGR